MSSPMKDGMIGWKHILLCQIAPKKMLRGKYGSKDEIKFIQYILVAQIRRVGSSHPPVER